MKGGNEVKQQKGKDEASSSKVVTENNDKRKGIAIDDDAEPAPKAQTDIHVPPEDKEWTEVRARKKKKNGEQQKRQPRQNTGRRQGEQQQIRQNGGQSQNGNRNGDRAVQQRSVEDQGKGSKPGNGSPSLEHGEYCFVEYKGLQ